MDANFNPKDYPETYPEPKFSLVAFDAFESNLVAMGRILCAIVCTLAVIGISLLYLWTATSDSPIAKRMRVEMAVATPKSDAQWWQR